MLFLQGCTPLCRLNFGGGKSGQHRVPCHLTDGFCSCRKDSATENNYPTACRREKVKMCGKSARSASVNWQEGKPHGLKAHVHLR